jgi:predicted MPP superfamily phosphohydrolase
MSSTPPGQTRRQFLLGAAALAIGGSGPEAALADAAGASAVRVEAMSLDVPGLDPAHDGLRVAQLSDIHVGRRTPPARIQAALDAVKAFQAELVVLTGDYLSHNQQGVGLLREALGGLAAPTVAVLGNHDHWVDADGATAALEGLGYAVLRNQHTVLRLRGVPFTVIGVDDLVTGHADPARALAGAPGGSRLVLAHAPRTADLLRDADDPLVVLSGHTHGGQISIPILTPLLARLVVGEPYLRGSFRVGSVRLYVNRGVGNTVTTVRLNSDPEVTTATLHFVEGTR